MFVFTVLMTLLGIFQRDSSERAAPTAFICVMGGLAWALSRGAAIVDDRRHG
jgi:hypothetical protein